MALARQKQHLERLHRAHINEMGVGKNSLDYGLVDIKQLQVAKSLPKLKGVEYNDRIDKQIFGEAGVQSIKLGLCSSPKSTMFKDKPRFHQESAKVTKEVYNVLGVRADKTLRPRKY